MKIVTIVESMLQVVKMAPVSRCLNDKNITEVIVNTGLQDNKDGNICADKSKTSKIDYYLNVVSNLQGEQTALMLEKIEELLFNEKPALVVVCGSSNSALAGALAASKMQIAIAHIGSGVRSYNRLLPEEINSVVVDKVSTLLFCSDENSVDNLKKEGIVDSKSGNNPDSHENEHFYTVKNVGEVLFDTVLSGLKIAGEKPNMHDKPELINNETRGDGNATGKIADHLIEFLR